MPELPEVEIVKRELKPSVVNTRIETIEISNPVYKGHSEGKRTIIKNPIDAFKSDLTGSEIISLTRRGKYLSFGLSKDNDYKHMVSHLGMSGAYFVVNSLDEIKEANYRNHTHIVLNLSTGAKLVYADIRRFGEMRIVPKITEFVPFVEMAPEYYEEVSLTTFLNNLKDTRFKNMTIKQAIMDARVIPGVGNIYANEALFRSGILPTRKAGRVSATRLISLHEEITAVLNEAIERGGSTISDYRNTSGESGTMQERFKIYQKKTCPECDAPLKTKVINTRNTFYCTECQR